MNEADQPCVSIVPPPVEEVSAYSSPAARVGARQSVDSSRFEQFLRAHLTPRKVGAALWTPTVLWMIFSSSNLSWSTIVLAGLLTSLFFVPNARPSTFVRVFRDWGAVLAWLVFYGMSRGAADTLGMPLQEQLWIDIDRVLGFGELPTHRLQQLIDWDGPARWWEATFPIMYVSHFLTNSAVLIVVYHRDRVAWGQWYRRIVLMGVIGVIGYVLLPSVPPWMASDNGTVELVHAGLPRGWDVIQIDWIHRLFEFGRDKANPIAAMPSLHAAFPVMLYLFWAPRSRPFVRKILASYALYMAFVIVITGQHWVIDVFAGWLVAYVAHRIMVRAEVWNAARKASEPASGDVDNETAPAQLKTVEPAGSA